MKSMKQILGIAMMAVVILTVNPVVAQTSREEKKEQKQQTKNQEQLRKKLFTKADKSAVKEAKKLTKEGWKTMGLPIEKQLEETWTKMYDQDASGYPRYITAQEMVTANSYSAAQSAADNVAKLRIASQISSSVAALVDIALANNEISPKEAASISKVVENSKIIISQKLGRVFKTLEIYRVVNNNYQIRVTMCYDMKAAMQIAHDSILEELKNDSEINKAQLEKIMGLDRLMEQSKDLVPDVDEVVE